MCCALSLGVSHVLVVNIGARYVDVTPVVHGTPLPHAVQRQSLGAVVVRAELSRLLSATDATDAPALPDRVLEDIVGEHKLYLWISSSEHSGNRRTRLVRHRGFTSIFAMPPRSVAYRIASQNCIPTGPLLNPSYKTIASSRSENLLRGIPISCGSVDASRGDGGGSSSSRATSTLSRDHERYSERVRFVSRACCRATIPS